MDDALDPAVLDNLRQLTPPGEPDVLTEVLTLFLDEAPKRIGKLRAAVAAGDAVGMQRAAHSLKGSAGNIGARALYDVCARLDEIGKTGDIAAAGLVLPRLDQEFGRTAAAIRTVLSG